MTIDYLNGCRDGIRVAKAMKVKCELSIRDWLRLRNCNVQKYATYITKLIIPLISHLV